MAAKEVKFSADARQKMLKGVDTLADEEDGLVSLPYEFEHVSSLSTTGTPSTSRTA